MRKERYQEDDFKVFVNELLSSCRLEGKEAGIAKLVLGKGYDNLLTVSANRYHYSA